MTLSEKVGRDKARARLEEPLEQRTVSLRDSESRFRSLAEGVDAIVLISDQPGMIRYINEVGARRLHWSSVQVIGRPLALILVPVGPLPDSGRSEEAPPRTETLYRTRTGQRIEVEETRWPIVFNGSPAILRIARDTSERKRAEEEKARLEHQLRESQKMQAIGTLAGGVAHDFNNLLTVILGHVHLMQMQATPGDDPSPDLTNIESAVHRAKALTQQLLKLAQRGKGQNTVVDVRSTIHEIITLLSRTFDKKITFQEESALEAVHVMGDPNQLHQVILNLSVNARDAMPSGGLITYRTEVTQPDERLPEHLVGVATGRYVKLSVRDTGYGIPADAIGLIFEPFFTTKDARSGTGMGLAMVQNIVHNHSGAIEVESVVGQGTTFILYLPLAEPGTPRVGPYQGSAPVAGTGTILLVDDEEQVRTVTAKLLRHLGYEVVTAPDGHEALEYYRGHRKDIALVILDLIMPRMNGRECFLALRSINPNVKVVLSTGCDKDSATQDLLDDGVQSVVQKPFELTQLSTLIAQAMGSRAKAAPSP